MSTNCPAVRDLETLDAHIAFEALEPCSDGKTGPRRFSMTAYTGAVVDRSYGKFVIDLAGIQHKERVPMLVDHDGGKIAGYADRMSCDEEGFKLSGVLSAATEHGRMVAALSDEGFPWQASVGIEVEEREDFGPDTVCNVNGMDLAGPISVARRCRLRETSFLYAGADSNTSAVALAANKRKEATVADTVNAAPVADTRAELAAFLAAFPGEEALAAQRFVEGRTVDQVRLEIAEKAVVERDELRQALSAVTAERDSALEKLATLADLNKQAGNPGIGFSGPARQAGGAERLAPQTPDQAWEQDADLRAEFLGNKSAFLAFVKREGFNPAKAK